MKRGKEEPNSAKELVNHFSYSSNCFKKTRMNKYQNIENTVKTLRELGYKIVNHYRGSGLGWLLQDFDLNHAVKIMIFSFLVDFLVIEVWDRWNKHFFNGNWVGLSAK